jgi:pSer/pThr/pTyr-binding forkhead associated (FHA) protein
MDTRQPVLIMIQGPDPGSIYKLPDNRVVTIGRSSRNTIPLVTPSVSRFHCEVSCVNSQWILTDLNSRKGTMVNGEWVAGRMTLEPGDLVRLTSTVFRFDLVEEGRRDDEAILAIKEAELDQRLQKKGEATGRLDDILVRSRLQIDSERHERLWRRIAVKANVIFLGAAALLVGAAAALTLLRAHGSLGRSGDMRPPPVEPVKPRQIEPLPRTDPEAAREAARLRVEQMWLLVEEAIERASEQEKNSNYSAALAAYDEIDRSKLSVPAAALVETRREQTVQLARAMFRDKDQQAKQHIQRGDKAKAREIYQLLSLRVGVAELAERARQMAAQL